MTLDILKTDMAAALKNGQTLMRSVLSDAIAAIQKTAIDRKQKDNITEELVNEVLLKEKKIIQEMIESCPENRTDLLEEYQDDPTKLWEANIFGKTLNELVNDGLKNKLDRMPEDAQSKLRETLERIINEGSGGLLCLIL